MLRISASKFTAPLLLEVIPQRNASSVINHYEKFGAGGRNSFNGVVATVFGATGFIGRYTIGRLAAAGAQIVVPYRGVDTDFRHLRVMGELGQIKFVEYHLQDKESLDRAISHSNVVINLVGRNFETRKFSYTECLETGARAIAEAAQSAGVERLIHVSHLMASESSPNKFLQAKAAGEKAVTEAFPSVTVMRPSDVCGDEDKYLNKFAYLRLMPFGIVPLIDNGWQTIKRPVFVADVAKAIVKATLDNSTAGQTYELYGPDGYYLNDMIDYVFNVILSKRPYQPVNFPKKLYDLLGMMGELSVIHSEPKLTRDLIYMQHLTEVIDESAASFADLGITPANLNDVGYEILRRHRHYTTFDTVVDDGCTINPAVESIQFR